MDVNRYSTLSKMLRITAYVCWFINSLKKKLANEEIKSGKVEVEEVETAELQWVKKVQKVLEGQPGYQKYKEQLGVVERNGILVCEGRLEFTGLFVRNSSREWTNARVISLARAIAQVKIYTQSC